MKTWLLPLTSVADRRDLDDARAYGGKAFRLAWLHRNGFAIPQTWLLPPAAFEALDLSSDCAPKALLRTVTQKHGDSRVAEARTKIQSAPLPVGLYRELVDLWGSIDDTTPWGIAVRSSATCEDGSVVSMAGLAESILGVRGADDAAVAIRNVWASIASPRALLYLANHGVRDFGIGIVLQKMVRADAAGVMFTRAPGTSRGNRERIINAGFGLGTPVVNGVSTPDVLRLDSRGRVLESVIANKGRMTVVGDHGLEERPVEQSTSPALEERALRDLAAIAARLDRLESGAWDVEFATEAGRVWLVQARPITGLGFPHGGDANTVWSSVNVGEALPGVATTLTWSVAGSFSETGFRSAFEALGCRVPKNAVLVGNVFGRFYLNLSEFMRIASQVPFLEPHTLVELGGGSGGDELASQIAHVSRRGFVLRLPLTLARLAREQFKLDANVTAYEAIAEKAYQQKSALDLAILPDEGLARTFADVLALLSRTGSVMLTCASSALGTHLLLKLLLDRIEPVHADRLAQSLTSGIRDLESARPGVAILHIANLARREPEARDAILCESLAGLDGIPHGPTRRALHSFLELYGDRAVREAELSTPRWRDDPKPVLRMLRVALRGDEKEAEPSLTRARTLAESDLQALLPRLSLFEQTALRHLVARAQKAARLRERTRAWVTRVLGMIRDVALDADRRLRRRDPEFEREAEEASRMSGHAFVPGVFFLTERELLSALRTGRSGLAPLVRARRAEYARDQARPNPPTTFVGAPPSVMVPPAGGDVLRGLPASRGIVEGPARVLSGEEQMGELCPGEVLVVHTTDIGWTPLFLVAAGVVTELGGTLSHAAIVAREFGVPSVVNVDGATRLLRTGDIIRVDGDRGTVERVRKSNVDGSM